MPGKRFTFGNPDGESYVPDAERFAFQQHAMRNQDALALAMLQDRDRDRQLQLAQGGTFSDQSRLRMDELNAGIAGKTAVARVGNEVGLAELAQGAERYGDQREGIKAKVAADAAKSNAIADMIRKAMGAIGGGGGGGGAQAMGGIPGAAGGQFDFSMPSPMGGASGGGASTGSRAGLRDASDAFSIINGQFPDFEQRDFRGAENQMTLDALRRQAEKDKQKEAIDQLPATADSLQPQLESAVGAFQDQDHAFWGSDPGKAPKQSIRAMRDELANALVVQHRMNPDQAKQRANQIVSRKLQGYGGLGNWNGAWADETRNLMDDLGINYK